MLWFFDSLLQDAICYKLLEQTIVSFIFLYVLLINKMSSINNRGYCQISITVKSCCF